MEPENFNALIDHIKSNTPKSLLVSDEDYNGSSHDPNIVRLNLTSINNNAQKNILLNALQKNLSIKSFGLELLFVHTIQEYKDKDIYLSMFKHLIKDLLKSFSIAHKSLDFMQLYYPHFLSDIVESKIVISKLFYNIPGFINKYHDTHIPELESFLKRYSGNSLTICCSRKVALKFPYIMNKDHLLLNFHLILIIEKDYNQSNDHQPLNEIFYNFGEYLQGNHNLRNINFSLSDIEVIKSLDKALINNIFAKKLLEHNTCIETIKFTAPGNQGFMIHFSRNAQIWKDVINTTSKFLYELLNKQYIQINNINDNENSLINEKSTLKIVSSNESFNILERSDLVKLIYFEKHFKTIANCNANYSNKGLGFLDLETIYNIYERLCTGNYLKLKGVIENSVSREEPNKLCIFQDKNLAHEIFKYCLSDLRAELQGEVLSAYDDYLEQ